MINYELPWNPNRLEQRIGRIHRYGQDNEVKVWNFTFEDTREGEIFDLLQSKVENIRSKIGNTADVLGMIEDIDVDSLIMESIRNEEPPGATKEELEEMIDERQRTLEEWYERSLIDTSTFDEESRKKIQEVIDDSEDIYGTEADIREFFERGVDALGGEIEKSGANLFRAELPESLRLSAIDDAYGPFTFDRGFAMEHEGIEYLSPDSGPVQRLMAQILDSDQGTVGLKLLPFIDDHGIVFNYRVRFEDGTGELVREEMLPVFVDVKHQDPKHRLGERVVQGDSIKGSPDPKRVRTLLENRSDLQLSADRFISQRVEEIRADVSEQRREETQQELENLEAYAQAERERLEEFIEEYRERQEGYEMEGQIGRQQSRLENLEERIERRRQELQKQAQIVSLAPEIENICLALPV